MKYRDKQTCFRCRALHVSPAGAGCLLGWDIEVANQPGGTSFYTPEAGAKCLKPLTHGALLDAVKTQEREKSSEIQLSLL
jgi:hypothetical protein